MMRVKVRKLREGLHPSEVVVSLATTDGDEKLVVDKRSIRDDTLSIGFPIGQDKDNVLVELPRETSRGFWRVWVNQDSLVKETVP